MTDKKISKISRRLSAERRKQNIKMNDIELAIVKQSLKCILNKYKTIRMKINNLRSNNSKVNAMLKNIELNELMNERKKLMEIKKYEKKTLSKIRLIKDLNEKLMKTENQQSLYMKIIVFVTEFFFLFRIGIEYE